MGDQKAQMGALPGHSGTWLRLYLLGSRVGISWTGRWPFCRLAKYETSLGARADMQATTIGNVNGRAIDIMVVEVRLQWKSRRTDQVRQLYVI